MSNDKYHNTLSSHFSCRFRPAE